MYQDKSEEFVIESEAKFRSAFDYAAIGMALVGLEGSWLEVNQALCETLGYSEPELLGLTFQDITHPADLEADLGCVQQLLAGEIRSYQIEKRYIHKQGQEVWVLLSVSLLQDANGQPLYFVSQIQNISQRKRVENNLRLQSTIVRNIAEGVCMLRAADGVIVYANPKFGQMFGYEPGELIDQHVSILNYPDVDEGSVESAERIMAEIHRQGEYTYEVHNIHKDRSDFWCRATTSVFEHPEYGCVYVAVQSDITQEKRAAAEIRLLQSLTLAISAAEDFDAALNLILQQVSETYGWIYGEAWIPNLEENVLHCSPAFYSCAKHQKGCCAL
ncbi:MAG: PAS domain S-box protein, partial [Leptolyngbyaceae cyanobacterium RM2_2_21]|nr:PAS domain S-box protein [Leptolyngbyaceae cyanobacterium RM2_2_21]